MSESQVRVSRRKRKREKKREESEKRKKKKQGGTKRNRKKREGMRKRWSWEMPRCRRCERQFCLLLTDWPYHRLGGARCTPLVLTTSGSAVRTKVRISFSAPLSTRVLVASISLFPAFSFSASTHKSVRAHLSETQRLNNLIITVATWLTLNLHTVSHSQFIVETTEIIIVISVFLTVTSVICISSGIVVATAATVTAAAATPLVITPAVKQIYRQTRFHHAVLLSCVLLTLTILAFILFSLCTVEPMFLRSATPLHSACTMHAPCTLPAHVTQRATRRKKSDNFQDGRTRNTTQFSA